MSEAREHLIYEARAVRTRKKRDEREIYQDSLINFMERAWSEIEPGEIDINWHHHEIAAALEDITWGRNRELIINIPPRCTKSLLCNVFWPAWTWAQEQDSDYPLAGPQVRFYCLSYGAKLATDIALKMSRLVTGVWYQGMWGDRVKIRDDQKARDNFGNTAGGERISNSIEGGLLGRGGDIQICFPYEEVVWTERGPIRIGEVVENRLALRCWSFNHNISQFELRPIIGWHSNPGRRLVRIVTDHGDLTCTEDHRILTMRGYVAARDLRSCDFIYSAIGLPDLTYRGSADAMPGRNLSYSSDIIYNCPDDVGSNPRCPSAAGIAYQAQMFPSAPRADRPNYSKADIVAFGKYAATFGASRNFSHLMFGQMRGPISEAAMGLTIGDILGSRPVFEPAKRSFSAVTVDMANFLSNWAWAEKSQRYEAMDLAIEMLSIPGQSHSRVPVDDRTSHDFTGHSNIPCAAANSRQASNPAEIRNLISREPVDRQPSFLRVGRVEFVHDIPSNTYCLTIEHNHNMVMGQANICASNCDDPHHLKGAESDTQRKETIEGMRSLSTRVTDPRIFARVLIMQRLHCLLPGTMVRVPTGHRAVDDLSVGDLVLGSLGWQTVSATSTMPFKGTAFGVRLFGHPETCWTTPNHCYLTARGWIRADHLTHQDWVRFPSAPTEVGIDIIPWEEPRRAAPPSRPTGTFRAPKVPSIKAECLVALVAGGLSNTAIATRLNVHRNTVHCYMWLYKIGRIRETTPWFGREHLVDPAFWRLVGYWVAEGCFMAGRGGSICGIRFTFNAAEIAYRDDVTSTLRRYGVTVKSKIIGNACQIEANTSQLARWLKVYFGSGAKNKRVPEFILSLPSELRAEVLEGWLRGDGCVRRTGPLIGHRSGTSASLALIQGMQRIALSLGERANIVTCLVRPIVRTIGNWTGTVSPSWELRLAPPPRRERSMRCKIEAGEVWYKIKEIQTKPYDGQVYDLTTPSHDFVVGNAVVHNTDDATNYGLENWRRPRHICYPMRFNEQIAHMQPTDPRQLDGELLWPRVWDEEAVAAEERELGNYGCTPAEAPVLMADLSLRPIANVKRGDEVVGFDTHHSSTAPQPNGRPDRRKLKRSTVLEVFKYPKAAIFKLTMRSGAVIRCTKDHLWYRKGKGPDRPTYAMPKVGRKLGRICDSALADIISCEDLRDAGWLGGFFDGEGTVSLCHKEAVGLGFRTSAQIHFYQRAGENLPNCENLERILTKFGFAFRVSKDERKPNKDAPCYEYRIYTLTGHDVSLTQRFLHIAQPIKWRERLIDSVYGAKFIREWDEIVSIEPDGIDDVYALKTTTGNYVVWGYASSNSSGQLQQAPVPRGGGIIQRNWWRLWPEDAPESAGMEAGYRCPVCKWAGFVRAADADGIACPSCGSLATKEVPFPQFSFRLLSVDTNLGEKEQDSWSAATSWEIWHGKNDAPRAMLTYAWRGRPHLHVTKEEAARGEMGLVERIHHIANLRKSDVVLIEKKTRGIDLFNELAMQAVEWPYRLEWFDPTGRGDKVYRLNAVSGLFTADLIWAPNKAWADTVITEVCEQPRAQFSDLADTCSMALIYLRQSLLLPTDEEHAREERRANLFRGNQPSIAQQIEG